ncbi:MAG: hypothetical protein JO083_00595 [Candidatus Eremiobacteraeota bacterium]|nr:hypothetical protein [Candidatus Eremiobacteraeota bacterium]
MIPETIVAGALYGCPDAKLELGYRNVVEVLRPTNEPNLATPEYTVRIYDRHEPDGWTTNISEFDFDESICDRSPPPSVRDGLQTSADRRKFT